MHSMLKSMLEKLHHLNSMLVIKYFQQERKVLSNWTEEVFTISSVQATKPPTYTIEDTLGEAVQGTFYEQELQLSVQEIFVIVRVLRKKKNQVFVKWKGYSEAFNSWVPLTDLGA